MRTAQTKHQATHTAYPECDPVDYIKCRICGDEIDPPARARLVPLCLWCGEEQAQAERKGWCIVQEYGKGNYQYVTASAANVTLKQTNQKEIRT